MEPRTTNVSIPSFNEWRSINGFRPRSHLLSVWPSFHRRCRQTGQTAVHYQQNRPGHKTKCQTFLLVFGNQKPFKDNAGLLRCSQQKKRKRNQVVGPPKGRLLYLSWPALWNLIKDLLFGGKAQKSLPSFRLSLPANHIGDIHFYI